MVSQNAEDPGIQIGSRLEQLRKSKGVSSDELAAALNIPHEKIVQIESGTAGPTFDLIMQLVDRYNISLEWFLTGQGEMFAPAKNAAKDDDKHIKVMESLFSVPRGRREKTLEALERVSEKGLHNP